MKSIVFLPIAVIVRTYFAAGYVMSAAAKTRSNIQAGATALKSFRPAQPSI